MTKMYIALALLAVIVAAGFTEYTATRNAADEVLAYIEQAKESSGEDAAELCRQARDVWHERKPLLQLFLPHPDLDAADVAIEKLLIYSQLHDSANTKIYLSEFEERIYAIKDGEEISIFNFM